AQDKTGFLWFGTRNGLNRFDGKNFKAYFKAVGNLQSNDVSSILPAEDGSLWIGTGTGLYQFKPSTESFQMFATKATDGTKISSNVLLLRYCGKDLIIATNHQGLFYYDTKNNKLYHNSFNEFFNISAVACDTKQRIWVSFYGQGLYLVDKTLKSATPFLLDDGKTILGGVQIRDILTTEQDLAYIGTEGEGVYLLNLNTRTAKPLFDGVEGKGKFVHSLARRDNDIIVATENGIYIYEMLTHELYHYEYEASNPLSLSDNSIQSLYCDKNGGLWAGTYFSGVCFSSKSSMPFDCFFPRIDVANSLHGRRVREMVEDNQGCIWIGTEDGGLNRFDPSTGEFRFIEKSADFPNIHGLCVVGDQLWVGAYSYGVVIIDTKTLQVTKTIKAGLGVGAQLHDNDIFAIEKTRGGDIYFGTLGGLCRYEKNGEVTYIDEVPHSIIYDVHEDKAGNLWAVIYGNSISCRKASTGKWVSYSMSNSKLMAKNVIDVSELSNGTILVTTEDSGIFMYDSKKDCFEEYKISTLAQNATTYSVLEDNEEKLWISTSRGLIWYDPSTKDSRTYTTANGLLDNNFNYKSGLVAKNGRIYLGCLKGVVAFSPDQFHDATFNPHIVATELLINNSPVTQYGENSPLSKSIVFSDEISLSNSENTFAIQIASLLYAADEQVQMEYMMKGFEDSWLPVPDNYTIGFTNLPPGHYKLLVRARAASDAVVGNQFEMDITIRPPFYRSWWAYAIYLLILALIIYFGAKLIQTRAKEQRENAMQKFEYEKEQELYQSKINFFTNVAHEIRTPLTLIKAPLEKLLKHKEIESSEKEELNIMDKNVSRLIELTNQLLDFRKAEHDSLKLNIERCNVTKVIDDVYVRFTPLMREKGIDSQFAHPEEPIFAYIDKEGFTKIISNMLNNAVKYCDHYINLDLRSVSMTNDEGKQVDEIKVVLTNDGQLVPQKLREKIFEPFERGNSTTSTVPGTGIGLPLARAIAELHEGTLCMQDDAEMNVFVLSLPMQKVKSAISLTKEEETTFESKSSDNPNASELPQILIVEDNIEMQNYERSQLEDEYSVLTAANGEEAMKVLTDNEDIVLIVSDVMMEPMGGFEFCREVKNDVNYSHIPVILLTALTLDSAKVEGMESGADAYIEKPFSMDYLRSSIRNLLRHRQSAKAAYAASPFLPSDTVTISKADSQFIKNLEEVMRKNMCDSDFGITELARELCMSRTGLNRKIRGVFNMSPNNYIKVERLKYAAYLMKSSNMRVSEVCYQVGFTAPSYFTQCFYKQFGLLPKDFLNQPDN
ncbi:MAG: two-component regulator propeller domain-containing protein, partial [Prevotellaceae bacterium]|nr:two-component regulator propeller domain-containing protein [Prevotellaceae bacterium]